MSSRATALLCLTASFLASQPVGGDACFPVTLGPPLSHRLPTFPREMATADFNRDGRADLAVAMVLSDSVAILLGNGDGTFTAGQSAVTGPGPVRLAVGDFNEDGKVDLAATDWHGNTVTILLGNGAGAFTGTDHFVGEQPEGVAVGDFNRDGHQDVVATTDDIPSSKAAVLLGDGAGGFAAAQRYHAGNDPSDVAVADLNEDGKADLVVPSQLNDDVAVLLGDGLGAFAAPVRYRAGYNPWSVAMADFDRDGHVDAAVGLADGMAVLRGAGNGTLGPPLMISLPGTIYWAAAGDIDRDGAVDLVAANATAARVEVMFGVGDGTFRPSLTSYPTPASSYFAMLADLNGDGRLDLVAQDAGGLTVRLNPTCVGRYFVLPPCRLVDTRSPSGGPALAANSRRTFPVSGYCGIPATAKAAALNLVAVNPGDVGNLRAFPALTAVPLASSLNFVPGRTRANNAVVALGSKGEITVQCDMPAGSTAATHFVLDVFGYFQ